MTETSERPGPSSAPEQRRALSSGSPVRRWAPWLALAVVVVAVLSVGAFGTLDAPTAQDRVNEVARTIRCPTCNGQSVYESNAPASREVRTDIADRIQQGQTDDEIRAAYADRYGEGILLNPATTGVTALVWVLPVVALAVALAGLVIVFRRWQREPTQHATDADRALVADALHPGGEGEPDAELPDDGHGEGGSR